MNKRAGEDLRCPDSSLVRARHLASYSSPSGSIPRPRAFDFAVGPRPVVRNLLFRSNRPEVGRDDAAPLVHSMHESRLGVTGSTLDQRFWMATTSATAGAPRPRVFINPCTLNRAHRHAGSSTGRSSCQEARLAARVRRPHVAESDIGRNP